MSNRIVYLDVLRIIAISAVLLLHASSSLATIGIGSFDFYIANIFNVITRFCVPLFLMISGALLITRDDDLFAFFKKRFFKVFFPAIVWLIFYDIFNIVYLDKNISLSEFFVQVIEGNVFFHLYFINLILGAYLFVPILNLIARQKQLGIYFLVIWFIAGTIFPLINKYIGVNVNFYIFEYLGWGGYMLLGYFLHQLNKKPSRFILASLFVLGFSFNYLGLIGQYENINFDKYFYGYKTLGILLETITLFLLVKDIKFQENKIITVLSDASYGMYLSHGMIMFILMNSFSIRASFLEYNAVINILIVFFLTVLISYSLVIFLKKVPYLKGIV